MVMKMDTESLNYILDLLVTSCGVLMTIKHIEASMYNNDVLPTEQGHG